MYIPDIFPMSVPLTRRHFSASAQSADLPVFAVSAKWNTFPGRFDWLAKQQLAAEYTADPDQFELLATHVSLLLNRNVPVRYHGFFPGHEIGNQDFRKAERAMDVHFKALKAMAGIGEQVITVHIGLTKGIKINPNRACRNLKRLVETASDLGITISLENLKQGITSNPELVRDWADRSGAMITLDVGHAVSCELVERGVITVPEIIDLFADRLIEVHLYERETDRHCAPENMDILGPIVDRLIKTDCRWWTIELESYEDILNTRQLVTKAISDK